MVREETGNDKGDTMKDKKKKKQKSEEKLKKKKALLLPDEKTEKEDRKKKKKKQLQEAADLERKEAEKAISENDTAEGAQDVWPTQETEEAFTALNQGEKTEKSAGKGAGRKPEKSAKTGKANRKKTADEVSENEAALIFRALGDETRLRIVGMLEEHELCAADLLKSVSIVQSTLSHHMKILCDSGAVNCRREGRWSYYSINAEIMEKAADYLKKYRKA